MNEELLEEIMDAVANLRDEYVDIEMVSEYHGHDIKAEIVSCPISSLLYTGDYIELLQKRVQELEKDIEQEYGNHKDLEASLLKENKQYLKAINYVLEAESSNYGNDLCQALDDIKNFIKKTLKER